MFKALHNRHFVHDPLGVVDDLLSGILETHLHHLFHGKLFARGHIVHHPHNTARTRSQFRSHIVLAGDHLGQVVRMVRFHVVEHEQLVLGIQDAYHVVGAQDSLVACAHQMATYIGTVARVVLYENRSEGVVEITGQPEVDLGDPCQHRLRQVVALEDKFKGLCAPSRPCLLCQVWKVMWLGIG